MTDKKYYWLYILRLNNGKYYVGRTSNKDPLVRIKQHETGFYSAQWVKMHGFVEVVEILDAGLLTIDEANMKETKLTLEYMKKYGFRNVRGGDYSYSGDYFKIGKKLIPDFYMALFVISLAVLSLAVIAWK